MERGDLVIHTSRPNFGCGVILDVRWIDRERDAIGKYIDRWTYRVLWSDGHVEETSFIQRIKTYRYRSVT